MPQNIFRIYDGRNYFWQWDTGQKLIVLDESIDQVHFSNKGMTHSISSEVIVEPNGTRVCNIPDVILMIPKNLIASAYETDGPNKTVKTVKFAVRQRPIPSDYIPDQDVETGDLVNRIELIEKQLSEIVTGNQGVNRFNSMNEAEKWANEYKEAGAVISVYTESNWTVCIVNDNYTIEPICSEDLEVDSTATHYEGTRQSNETDQDVIDRVLNNIRAVANNDDIFIVKSLISDDHYSRTAYVYNGVNWIALDGNYNADNIYFDKDMLVTTEVGYITLENGQGYVPSKGKNLSEVFEAIYVKEFYPNITQPSVSLKSVTSGSYEVGTSITPTWSATFNPGSYSYGPDTNVSIVSWEITDTNGNSASKDNGSFPAINVEDTGLYKIIVNVSHTDGAIPVTNKGNKYTEGQILAGVKSTTSEGVTGYRSYFYGVLNTTDTLTSDIIRNSLINGGNYNSAKTFTLKCNENAKRIVVAIPSNSTRAGLKEVILTSAMNTPITDSYGKIAKAVKVEGKNGYTAIDYDIYVYEPSKIDAGEIHEIKLA